MYDVSSLKAGADLLAIVEADLGPPRRRNGRWYCWPCPFHDDGERDGGSLRVTPDTGTWFCFGCHTTGDAISWIRRRQGLSFGEACQQLGGTSKPVKRVFATPRPPVVYSPPDQAWQKRVEGISSLASLCLWGPDTPGLGYLHRRGLRDETITHWQLGYNPGRYEVPEIRTADDRPAIASRGITIPVRMRGELWALKIRQPDGMNPKYVQIAGGRPALFGADTLTKSTALLTEGEFDAMLAWQEAGDLVGVASTAGGAKTWHKEWAMHLLSARLILVAYDTDPTGEEAATSVIATLGPRARRVTVPTGKDITDYWKAGHSVREWVMSLLPDLPPKPSQSCPICSNSEWQWQPSGGWACSVCGPDTS
jgi:DNA primase